MASSFPVSAAVPFSNSVEHLLGELERIDLLVQVHVNRARRLQTGDEFRGLCISEQEVDELLTRPAGLPRWSHQPLCDSELQLLEKAERLRCRIAERTAESDRRGVRLPLVGLQRRFDLTRFDMDAVLLCLALEIDSRYERLYAYLQDDVTRKRPGVDLILGLLCPGFEQRIEARSRFTSSSPLLHHQIVVLYDDQNHARAPLPYRNVQLDDRVANYLLGHDGLDVRLIDSVQVLESRRSISELVLPEGIAERIRSLAGIARTTPRMTIYLQGAPQVGKQSVAEGFCRELDMPLLIAELEQPVGGATAEFRGWLRLALREATLRDSAIYFRGFEALLRDEQRAARSVFVTEIRKHPGVVLLGGETLWEPGEMPPACQFVRLELAFPDYPDRLRLWHQACSGSEPDEWMREVAGKYRLSGGQIRDSAATAYQIAVANRPLDSRPTLADFQEACRLHSNRKLATLARRIRPQYRWKDIVLPHDRIDQLQQICASLQYRPVVYGDWGFDKKLSLGKGLNVLFAGPSGTGKTMAAEVLAGELGLELYKTDLSTIVSKYIGETEKNLSRIFAEAASSNAILFFDEADALFGKRSEVRDSHDRYANIEVNYLLQEMERYEGMAILATNLRKNMDEAFVRRMHFLVDFPFPNAQDRLRIWKGLLPEDTPRAPGLDLEFLAASFEMSGGSLKNVALSAAFLAASDGGRVTMAHLIRATRSEYKKMGKVLSGAEFGEYSGLAGL